MEIAEMPLDERVKIMSDSSFRDRLLGEEGVSINPLVDEIVQSYEKMFKLGEPANYEPDPKDSFQSLSETSNRTAQEIDYDAMLEKEGRALIYHPLFNYQPGDLSLVEKMLKHPYTISGLVWVMQELIAEQSVMQVFQQHLFSIGLEIEIEERSCP